jgi:signal transduction histidine kinase
LSSENSLPNFISNAIKHGISPLIHFTAETRGEFVRLQVADNGPGVPDDAKTLVFEENTQIDKRKIDGLGLGLFIVNQIRREDEGTVGVDDAPRGGSVLWMLPNEEKRFPDMLSTETNPDTSDVLLSI